MQIPDRSARWIAGRLPDPVPPPKAAAPAVFGRPSQRLPDLQSQLEELLDAVWGAEANWRFDDRLDMALGFRRGTAAA